MLIVVARAFLLLSLLTTASCTQVVSGKVFSDVNGNGKLDEGESGIAGLKLTIKKEGKALGEAETDVDGNYTFEVGSGQTTTKVKFCTVVKLSSLYAQSTTAAPALALQTTPSQQTTTVGATAGTTTPAEGDTEAGQSAGQGQEAEDTSPEETPESGGTSEAPESASEDGTEVCREGAGEIKIEVAIARQYQNMVSQTSVPPTKRINVGETTSLALCYPEGCSPAPVIFPVGVEPASSVGGFNPMTRQVVLKNLQQTPTVSATVFPGGKILCEPLAVRATREAESQVRVTPTAVCADDSVISLHPHVIEVKKTADVIVEQKITSGSPALSNVITVEALAKNNSGSALPEAKLTMSLPNFVGGVVAPSTCNNLGEKVECKTANLTQSAEMKMSVSFQLPAQINETTTFKVITSFSSSVLSSPVAAEEISFTIQGPPEEDDDDS